LPSHIVLWTDAAKRSHVPHIENLKVGDAKSDIRAYITSLRKDLLSPSDL